MDDMMHYCTRPRCRGRPDALLHEAFGFWPRAIVQQGRPQYRAVICLTILQTGMKNCFITQPI